MSHVPVLLRQVTNALLEVGGCRAFLDCTFGGGGYSKAVLEALPSLERLYVLDRDAVAMGMAEELARSHRLGRKIIPIHGKFTQLQNLLPPALRLDGAVFDLGVSSMQIDDPERGFSYLRDGPLDMRMSSDDDTCAADLVNSLDEAILANSFFAVRLKDFI